MVSEDLLVVKEIGENTNFTRDVLTFCSFSFAIHLFFNLKLIFIFVFPFPKIEKKDLDKEAAELKSTYDTEHKTYMDSDERKQWEESMMFQFGEIPGKKLNTKESIAQAAEVAKVTLEACTITTRRWVTTSGGLKRNRKQLTITTPDGSTFKSKVEAQRYLYKKNNALATTTSSSSSSSSTTTMNGTEIMINEQEKNTNALTTTTSSSSSSSSARPFTGRTITFTSKRPISEAAPGLSQMYYNLNRTNAKSPFWTRTHSDQQLTESRSRLSHLDDQLDELEDLREHFGILNSSHLSLNLPRSYQLKRSELLFKAHKILFPDDNIENESRHQGASSSSNTHEQEEQAMPVSSNTNVVSLYNRRESRHHIDTNTACTSYNKKRKRSAAEIRLQSKKYRTVQIAIQDRTSNYQRALAAFNNQFPHPFASYFPDHQAGVPYAFPPVMQFGTAHGTLAANIRPSIFTKSILPSNPHPVIPGQQQVNQRYYAWHMIINSTHNFWNINRLQVAQVMMTQQEIMDAMRELCTKVSGNHDIPPYLQHVAVVVTSMNAIHNQNGESTRGVGFGVGAARDGLRNEAGLSGQGGRVLVFRPIANNGNVPVDWSLINSYPMNAPNHDALYTTRRNAVNNLAIDSNIVVVSRNAHNIDHYDV